MKHSSLCKLTAALVLTMAAGLNACKKENSIPVTPDPTALNIIFTNMVGDTALVLNSKAYTNSSGEQFTVSTLNYYISNIKLTKSDNTVYAESSSYHLIQAEAGTLSFTLANVPAGSYTAITFMVGVDSLRNVSGAQTGALDPQNGMFWTWNSGYIMTKLEGKSVQTQKSFEYHIGGFSGPNSVLKTLTFPLPSAAQISATLKPTIQLKTDVAKWFDGPTRLSIAVVSSCTVPGAEAKTIAGNYANAFSVLQVTNK